MKHHIKITIAGKFEFIKTVEATDPVQAVQYANEQMRLAGLACTRVETVSEPSQIAVEVQDDLSGFKFRAGKNGEFTEWIVYTHLAFVSDHVVATEYFHSSFFALTPIPVGLHMLMGGAASLQSEATQIYSAS